MNQRPSIGKRTGLARALSKLGFCSRSRGREYILNGQVKLNGKVCRDPAHWVELHRDRIEIDSAKVHQAQAIYLMLNKPRGLVTTASDEQGRATVFSCLQGHDLPALSAVGRLDKASEGLLLFTNDTAWAAHLTSPEGEVDKIYHVQVDSLMSDSVIEQIRSGVQLERDFLKAKSVTVLRQGSRNSWLEIVLTEGKNRHIRRLLDALGLTVLRLIRISIGPLRLGDLPKGQFRYLTREEIDAFSDRRGWRPLCP